MPAVFQRNRVRLVNSYLFIEKLWGISDKQNWEWCFKTKNVSHKVQGKFEFLSEICSLAIWAKPVANSSQLLINSEYWAISFCLFENELVSPHFTWQKITGAWQLAPAIQIESCNIVAQVATWELDSNCWSNTNVAVEVCKVVIKRTSVLTVKFQSFPVFENRNNISKVLWLNLSAYMPSSHPVKLEFSLLKNRQCFW